MRRIVRFLTTGGTAALINLSLLYIGTEKFGLWYLWAAVIAFTAAVSFNFTAQRMWVFENRTFDGLHRQFSLFLAVALSGNVANASLLYVVVEFFDVWYLAAQVVVMGILAIVNFFLYQHIFRIPATREDA